MKRKGKRVSLKDVTEARDKSHIKRPKTLHGSPKVGGSKTDLVM